MTRALADNAAARIGEAVEANFADQVSFTAELVGYPSLRGQEHTAQDFMARAFRDEGLDVDRWQVRVEDIQHLPGFSPVSISYDNAFNVVGSHRAAQQKGRSLILNGHIDVVPEGPHDMWNSPPFEAKQDGNWLFGRGAGDMKAGLVCCLYALKALKRAGYQPASDLFIQSVIEEECTGNGALACLQRGYRADAAIIPEPSGDHLGTAQTGTIWMQITVRGLPAHAAYAEKGNNAIKAAMRLIAALEELEEQWNAEKDRHPHHAHLPHPINFNIGNIVGGEWPASVPAQCVFDLRAAIFADDDINERSRQLEDCIREAAASDPFMGNNPPDIAYHGFLAEGYVLENAEEPVALLEACHKEVHGQELEGRAGTGTTDARFFGLYADIPGLVYGPVARDVHGFNECVDLDSVRRITQTIALFVADWCGLDEK
jgi:acetylornithine deacetylase